MLLYRLFGQGHKVIFLEIQGRTNITHDVRGNNINFLPKIKEISVPSFLSWNTTNINVENTGT